MDIELPKWGVSMQEGLITEWLVEVGAVVSEGDPILEVETDKANAEIEAPVDGVITARLVAEGDRVPVGTVVATIDESNS
jgi:pyruvate/2-oxoglutarate dehydrogenase complex dihydrolipoamide acyltransferase (E2) component